MSRPTEPDGEGRALGDSAGQPWTGRRFNDNAHAADDGGVAPQLASALEAFRSGTAGQDAVVDAFRSARLLIPLVAEAGEEGVNARGVRVDKTQELSIVAVEGPDGRSVLPVFSCVATMATWNAGARPVPADGRRVALAAAAEGTELVVLDPGSPAEFVVRRPALWAVAQGEPWVPAWRDDAVRRAFESSIETEPLVHAVTLEAGDPDARLVAPELAVRLTLAPGLTQSELDAVLARLARRWAADDVTATRIDSLAVTLAPAPA